MVPWDQIVKPSESLSLAIIEAVAEEEGVDPVRLEPPLYTVLDPDALDQLFQSNGNGTDISIEQVTLTYHGYEVTVYSDGRIIARKPR